MAACLLFSVLFDDSIIELNRFLKNILKMKI